MIYWQLVAVFAVLSVLGFGGGNAIELTWPYRAKVADVVLLLAVGGAVLLLHFSLALMFLIFIPLSMVVQHLVRAE